MATYSSRPVALQVLLRGQAGPVKQQWDQLAVDTYRQARLSTSQAVNRRTGAYERGFDTHVEQGDKGPRMLLTNTSDHAVILELGSRPHIIRPRFARFLRFTAGGRTVFARSVNHPGTRPYRIMQTALERVMARYR